VRTPYRNEDWTGHSELIFSKIATKSSQTAILAVAIIHVQLQ